MIFDQLPNLSQYLGIHSSLDKAIDYIIKGEYKNLPVGSHHIIDNELILNVNETDLTDVDPRIFEYHEVYADLHLLIEGEESLAYGYGETTSIENYNEDNDFGLVDCQSTYSMELSSNNFALFLPKEPHQPGQKLGENKHIKKIVVKVLMN